MNNQITDDINTLCVDDGIEYEHGRKTRYIFKKDNTFKGLGKGNGYGIWSIENLDQYTSLLKMDYKNGKQPGTTCVYFKFPLKKGENKSILELQTGYKKNHHVTLKL
jgi:hypothetical protein